MHRLSRRAVVALVAGVGVVVATLVVTGFALVHRTDQVASIDGHPVTRDELLFHLRRLEPTAQNGQAALDAIYRDKTALLLAKEQGLVDAVDHADFLAEVDEENERRANALANGEVVYGVTEFSAEEYYSHRLTEIRTAVEKRLSTGPDDPLWVTEAEVRRAFDADRDKWNAGATAYHYSKLVVRVPDSNVADVRQRAAAAGDLAEIAAREKDAELTTGTYDGAAAGVTSHGPDLMPLLESLAPGETSEPVLGADAITFYRLDRKTIDEKAAFAKYAGRIRLSLVDAKLDELLRRRIAASDIQVDSEAVAALNPKDVRE